MACKPNYRQIYAKQAKYKSMILKANPQIDNESGIYFLIRTDEDGISSFYIGQAKKLLQRMCSHMTGYQHIDLSLKKRGFQSKDNPYGWRLNFKHYPIEELDKWEQYWILEYTKQGYQARYNKTSGSQGEGKEKINEFRPAKGYRDGIKQGRKTMARDLKDISDKHLNITLKNPNNKVSQRMYEKFLYLLGGEEDELQG